MKKVQDRNFHLPLPEELHRRLHLVARRRGTAATAAAREAIEYWLEEQERAVVHEAVAEYARSAAGTAADLDSDLEAAAVEHLLVRRGEKKK
ncbi:MAG: hypothetical protein ACREQY_11010 [Candidatus Binatia bacterium]